MSIPDNEDEVVRVGQHRGVEITNREAVGAAEGVRSSNQQIKAASEERGRDQGPER